MVEKNPQLAYKSAVVDRRYVESQCEDFTYLNISDVEVHNCVWNAEETLNECQRDVVVLGNY